MPEIKVTIKLFAAYQETYGVPELQLELPGGTTVGMVGDRLRAPYPALESLATQTRYGINLEFVTADTVVQDGDEIVLIPPVSGG
jgi:molybdopterin synthase sulfur carrier subunit